MPHPTAADPLSTTFAALADPTRRAILARLSTGEASVTELAEPFTMSLPAVSRHLKVLEPAALKPVDHWLDTYRQFWAARLDRLESHLGTMQAHGPAPPPARRRRRRS
jgi:DNA-binding transcriptional ArsR family regulator